MPFRRVQRFKAGKFVPVIEESDKTLETGNVIREVENQCDIQLPDASLFDINNQIKAGIDLEEVNSKVLTTPKIALKDVVRKYTRKSKPADKAEE